ncbi:MAG: hypothetical protein JW814_02500 [Candidatus Krumholzibacteriota bacterium]|nr:hypothetical protein [Candidatus Krumholzibacteriota bacterium]
MVDKFDNNLQNAPDIPPDSAVSPNLRLTLIIPLMILVILNVLIIYAVFTLSGGKEIADDARILIYFSEHPLVLWGDYTASGISDNWGSFPPLLPLLFSILVYPWLRILPDFWGLRIGILSWTVMTMFVISLVMDRIEGFNQARRRSALVLFSLLPSVWGAVALIPQEEIYASLFVITLYVFAKKEWWKEIVYIFILTTLAGKYFLLILAIPIALASPRSLYYFRLWTLTCITVLAAHIGYHRIFFGLTPVIAHMIDPGSSLSLWALFWNLGLRISEPVIKIASLILATASVSLFCWRVHNRIPMVFMISGALYLTLLTISITFPAYVLWVLPLMLICLSRMEKALYRGWTVFFMVVWGAGEWGSNLFRGVALALGTSRAEGKTRIADLFQRCLGDDFPFSFFHILCLILVITSAIALIFLLCRAGIEVQNRKEPDVATTDFS